MLIYIKYTLKSFVFHLLCIFRQWLSHLCCPQLSPGTGGISAEWMEMSTVHDIFGPGDTFMAMYGYVHSKSEKERHKSNNHCLSRIMPNNVAAFNVKQGSIKNIIASLRSLHFQQIKSNYKL
jgi:hypothetical protein